MPFNSTLRTFLQNVLKLTMTCNSVIVPISNATLFISFVYRDEIEEIFHWLLFFSNTISPSGGVYSNLLTPKVNDIWFLRFQRYTMCQLLLLNEKFVPSFCFTLFANINIYKKFMIIRTVASSNISSK